MEHPLAHLPALSCGNDHACVWYRDTDACYDLGERIIVDPICESARVNIVGIAKPWHTDRVRAYAESRFEMFCVHKKAGKFIAVLVKAKEDADTYIIYAAFHSAVHRFCVVIVIVLWPCWMKLQIAFLMVCLLEQDVSPDFGFFQKTVIIHGRSGDIHTADRAVFMLDAVNRVD